MKMLTEATSREISKRAIRSKERGGGGGGGGENSIQGWKKISMGIDKVSK